MCDNFGGTAKRYDWNLVTDPISKAFLSEKNAAFLKKQLTQRGYTIGSMRPLLPYMYDVLSTTVNTGYDPSVCMRTESFPLAKLNNEFLNYVIPMFENQLCMYRRYTMDQKYGQQPLDQPISSSCKRAPLFYNNRW